MAVGDVTITIQDNFGGSIVVPQNTVQVVLGTCSGGVVGTPVVASGIGGPKVLQSALGYGIGVEAASLSCLAGGTVIYWKTATKTKGTGSSVTATAGNTSTSVLTLTQDATNGAYDDGFFVVKVITGGTIGTSATIAISADAGRNYGPNIALGTANTYVISNWGTTINFAAGTLVTGDTFTFATYAASSDPSDVNGGISQVLTMLQNSTYGLTGWGSLHIVGGRTGTQTAKGYQYSDAHSVQGYLDGMATADVFSGAILSARDASPAAKWGGTAETEAAWISSLSTDYGAPSDRRIMACAGFYNMPSATPNASFGSWVPRRSLAWAVAARQVAIALKTLASRVSDGPLSQITVNSASDPTDGFVYHDERNVGGLDAAHFCSATTRVGYKGFFAATPWLMSPFGSDYDLWPKRVLMDAACYIVRQRALLFLNSDTRLNANGTIFETDARGVEAALKGALDSALTSTGQISACQVSVDRTTNVQATKQFVVTVTIQARGYILNIPITIGFGAVALS